MKIPVSYIKTAKIYLQHGGIDFVTVTGNHLHSLISSSTYAVSSIIGLDVLNIKTNEYAYHLKNSPDNIPTASEIQFYLARSLNTNIHNIISKNMPVLIEKYKQLLLKTLDKSLALTNEERNVISQIQDETLLLQYLPRDKSYYVDISQTKKYKRLIQTRNMLYRYINTNQRPFEEIYQKQLIWAHNCLQFFNLPGFKYSDFDVANETCMLLLRSKWFQLIKETSDHAIQLLQSELAVASKNNDSDIVLEINTILHSIQQHVDNAMVDMQQLKTPRELLKVWPEILYPGPIYLHP